ncbi:hypothetical protein BW730_16335 [Tessaracoccus aquimaris]|uniref:Carbohydrate kinase PfkB domain-containing protein n=1 Tax=Tessaracoccus aquimaris TaxID=1332264 RepID=A0A1Q2CRT4_9ACTN|nr:sugar kinase [Tessaracoccus aquimaris]AQP48833.1 hypothetical protein BW730_16335 [Tessaracoccus aquimaris]
MIDVVTLGEVLASFRMDGPLRVGTAAAFSFVGAESNVAVGLTRLGHRAALVGATGADALSLAVRRGLAGEGVDCSRLRIDPDRPGAVVVLDAPLAGVRRVSYLRTGSAGSALTDEDVASVVELRPRILHVSGVTCALGESAARVVERAVTAARERGVLVSLDLNYRSSLWGPDDAAAVLGPLARRADVLFGSEDELALVLGSAADGEALSRLGPSQVIVKRGPAGASCIIDGAAPVEAPSVASSIVDPVGAGDAFAAGYLSGLLIDLAPAERLARANAVAAFALGNQGDWEGLPRLDDLRFAGIVDEAVR